MKIGVFLKKVWSKSKIIGGGIIAQNDDLSKMGDLKMVYEELGLIRLPLEKVYSATGCKHAYVSPTLRNYKRIQPSKM